MKNTFFVQNNKFEMKKDETERESAGNFLNSIFILCFKYLMT